MTDIASTGVRCPSSTARSAPRYRHQAPLRRRTPLPALWRGSDLLRPHLPLSAALVGRLQGLHRLPADRRSRCRSSSPRRSSIRRTSAPPIRKVLIDGQLSGARPRCACQEARHRSRATGRSFASRHRHGLRQRAHASCATSSSPIPSVIGTTVPRDAAGRRQCRLAPSRARSTCRSTRSNRKVSDQQVGWMNQLAEGGRARARASTPASSSTAPRAVRKRPVSASPSIGSLYMMLIVLVLSLPIGVAASIYLEEFAPKNRLTDLIEVNINNLAAVPSIVYGLLGLAVFINFAGLPRSAALVGGLVLTLMTLADDHHRHPRSAGGRAAVDPLRSARSRRLEDADDLPPRAAARHARHPDRHDHRPGARTRRNRAAAVDRHGGLRRQLSDDAARIRRRRCRCRSTCGPTRPNAPSSNAPRAPSSSCSCS